MAKIGLPKGSGKQSKVREKSVKSQGILKWILSGNPAQKAHTILSTVSPLSYVTSKFHKRLSCFFLEKLTVVYTYALQKQRPTFGHPRMNLNKEEKYDTVDITLLINDPVNSISVMLVDSCTDLEGMGL